MTLDHRTKQVMMAAMMADRSRALARLQAGTAAPSSLQGDSGGPDGGGRHHRSAGAANPREPWQSLADYKSIPKVLEGNSAQAVNSRLG